MDRKAAQGSSERRAENKGLAVQHRHSVREERIVEGLKLRGRGSEGVGACEGGTGLEMKGRLLLGDGPGARRNRHHRLDGLPGMAQKMTYEAKLVIKS